MVGAFSTLIDAIGMASKMGDSADIGELAKALNGTKSITERARKSIFVYPVLFSSGMSDLEKDFTIAKFLELEYGIFTLMTVGLNPSVENGDISEYLKTVSAESFENVSIVMKPVDPNQIDSWYNMFSTENKDFFDEYKFGSEANHGGTSYGADDNDIHHTLDVSDDFKKYTDKLDKATDKLANERMESARKDDGFEDPFDVKNSDMYANALEQSKIVDKIGKAAPTMITLKIKVRGYQNDFFIPIALKASPHFLRAQDLSALFDSAVEDKRLLTRIVKLSSGEISFFKDFLFNMDRIKRDQDLYKAFGQHPWYQQFISRKEKNGAKRIGIIASILSGNKSIISASNSNYLPTASIILTQNELEHSANLKYGFLMKNEKIMWSILNHLGLLCIGVYNPEFEIMNFFFNGFKKPLIMNLKDMKDGKKADATEDMVKLMTLMMKRGLM